MLSLTSNLSCNLSSSVPTNQSTTLLSLDTKLENASINSPTPFSLFIRPKNKITIAELSTTNFVLIFLRAKEFVLKIFSLIPLIEPLPKTSDLIGEIIIFFNKKSL